MDLTITEWHDRFCHQAKWTAELRKFVFQRLNLSAADNILEVGCGTGAVLRDFSTRCDGHIVGIDIKESFLNFLKKKHDLPSLICGDGTILPFPNDTFDLTYCHFLLLWVEEPVQILKEMARVTRSGSPILVLAEPDYGGRIDHPAELEILGRSQMVSLTTQGANPLQGRELASLLVATGLVNVNSGVIGGHWDHVYDEIAFSSEWQILRADLIDKMHVKKLDKLERIDRENTIDGSRVLFVPTFYGWGIKV